MAGPPKAGQLPLSETHKIITRYLIPVGTLVHTTTVKDNLYDLEESFNKKPVTLTSELIFSDEAVVAIEDVNGKRLPGSMRDASDRARYVTFNFKHDGKEYIIRVRMGDILEADFIRRIVLSDEHYKTAEDELADMLRKHIDDQIMKELKAEMQKNLLTKMMADPTIKPYIPISVV